MTDPVKVNLRAMEPEDLDLLYRIENDHELWSLGSTNVPYSRYALHEYMANSTGDIYTDKQVRLIIENEDRVTVGLADLTNSSRSPCAAKAMPPLPFHSSTAMPATPSTFIRCLPSSAPTTPQPSASSPSKATKILPVSANGYSTVPTITMPC